jgi:preprotein translocase subunit SecG
METVILVVHILASIAMTGLVLVQKSEGGALGIGGGGGGLMSGRGAAGALVRTTIIFGSIFFITSLALTTIASRSDEGQTSIERSLQGDDGDAPVDMMDPNATVLDEQLGLDTPNAVTPDAPSEADTGIDLLDAPAAPAETPAEESNPQ